MSDLNGVATKMEPPRPAHHNQEAERHVIGSVLRDNHCLDAVQALISAEAFYADGHRKIFAAALALLARGQVADLVTTAEEISRRGQTADTGGPAYLYAIWDATTHAGNAEYYAKIVRDRWLQRRLVHLLTQQLRDAYECGDVSGLLSDLEREIFALGHAGTEAGSRTLAECVNESFARQDRPRAEGPAGVSTGIASLDMLLDGLHAGELTIVAARPGTGKTAFACHLSVTALLAGERVFFASMEQPGRELAERMICNRSRVNGQYVRRCSMTDTEKQDFYEAGQRLRELTMRIDDLSGQTVRRVAANCRRMASREGLDLVVLDYLQLTLPEDRRIPKHEQLGMISGGLKRLARDLKVPVVALAQLNREVESRGTARPRLADLKGSGDIEQDADNVWLLWRPNDKEPYLELDVAKQRNGPSGEVILHYYRDHHRFEDAAASTPFGRP